jgi:secreted trypsin-like serine protease
MSPKVMTPLLLFAFWLTPNPVQAQGSVRLLEAERQWDEKKGLDQRIIGGKPVSIKDNPWQVAIVSARVPSNLVAQFCGASIIAPRWVVTAAHCVDSGTQAKQVQVLVGTDALDSGGTRVIVLNIIVHDTWKKTKNANDFDIALLETESDLGGTSVAGNTATAEFPSTLQIRVTGWGRTSKTTNAGSKTLQGIEIPYVTRATCNLPASYDGDITVNMICAGVREGGVDSCQGDSGGPATAVVDGTRRLFGIVSWGEGCALRDKYGVYTNVSQFTTWVRDNTKGAVKW